MVTLEEVISFLRLTPWHPRKQAITHGHVSDQSRWYSHQVSSLIKMDRTSKGILPTRQSVGVGIPRSTGNKGHLKRIVQILINAWSSQLSSSSLCFGNVSPLSLVSILNRKRDNKNLNYKYILFISCTVHLHLKIKRFNRVWNTPRFPSLYLLQNLISQEATITLFHFRCAYWCHMTQVT